LATGHYVLVKKMTDKDGQSGYGLFRGLDTAKDQSYFLYNLGQRQLSRLIFPLGGYAKEEVKAIARREGLPYLTKESQDICFLNEAGRMIEHNEFLKNRLALKPGLIKEIGPVASKLLGRHSGLPLYTLGQRKGVEVGGTGPYYVAGMDYESNTLHVVSSQSNPILFRNEFYVKDVAWASVSAPDFPLECEVQTRYRQRPVLCSVIINLKSSELLVKLNTAERAITAGQSAVFYSGKKILGGGIIRL
jgi:tRNA-uridine 2-sulfurtransferase